MGTESKGDRIRTEEETTRSSQMYENVLKTLLQWGVRLSSLQGVQHGNMTSLFGVRKKLRRIMRTHLYLHLYKIGIGQELSPVEWGRRMDYSQQCLSLAFCGEAMKHISTFLAQWNFSYWSAQNTRKRHARLFHNPKVTIWRFVSSIGTIEPYFFWRWKLLSIPTDIATRWKTFCGRKLKNIGRNTT